MMLAPRRSPRRCQFEGRHAAATQLSTDAFATSPQLAEDFTAGHHFNAAGHAALAASGMGDDDLPMQHCCHQELQGFPGSEQRVVSDRMSSFWCWATQKSDPRRWEVEDRESQKQ
jgi:hypothetical protein